MASPSPTQDQPVLFRPSKKRKIYRQRAADEDAPTQTESSPPRPTTTSPPSQSLDELISSASAAPGAPDTQPELSMSDILRLRKKTKRGGVEFKASTQIRDDDGALITQPAPGDVEGDEEVEVVGGIVQKFARQTGAVGDVNRHMMAYIDSEIAKRRAAEGATQLAQSQNAGSRQGLVHRGSKAPEKETTDVQRQPATLGKLMEIDLGEEARDKNVQRTNMARRRLDGESVEDEEQTGKKPAKVRLGRDGKPWRGRKRRGSEDIARDKMVEDILRENRLEIYDEPVPEPESTGNDQAADDRIAEAFRKEFMDAVSARQRKKVAPPAAPARSVGGKKEEEVLKGPKLGGSRSARAAMRETMLKAAKK